MNSREKQIDFFFKNVEDASKHFNEDKLGNLFTSVHTNNYFPNYELEIIFHSSFIQILTHIDGIDLIVNNSDTYYSLENLFCSINLINKNGQFYLDKKTRTVSFMTLCYLEDIINADNPWMVIFSGIETTNHFAGSIDDVLNGSTIFYIKQCTE